jgi:hypothetical protein
MFSNDQRKMVSIDRSVYVVSFFIVIYFKAWIWPRITISFFWTISTSTQIPIWANQADTRYRKQILNKHINANRQTWSGGGRGEMPTGGHFSWGGNRSSV